VRRRLGSSRRARPTDGPQSVDFCAGGRQRDRLGRAGRLQESLMPFRTALLGVCVLVAAPAIAAPFPSTYSAPPAGAVLLRGATVLTGTGERLERADVLLRDGKIAAVGPQLAADGAEVIDAGGRW